MEKYYPINEAMAKSANDANSTSGYREGSATDNYRDYVDRVYEIVDKIARERPRLLEKAKYMADRYSRKLAEYYNAYYRNEASCPSILISGGSNFPVRKKEKQNSRRESLFADWMYLEGYAQKIENLLTMKQPILSGDEKAIELPRQCNLPKRAAIERGGAMGTINILARRRADGAVQYGWSGSWHPKNVGEVLIAWYRNDAMVDYLFSMGQVANLGSPLSETCGGRDPECRTCPTGTPYWTADSESEIFSRVPLIDAAYFYDADKHWYYVTPRPMMIKIPLELMEWHLHSVDSIQAYRQIIEGIVAIRILIDRPKTDPEFADLLEQTMSDGRQKLIDAILASKTPLHKIADDWTELLDYFDRWVVVVPDEGYKEVSDVLLHKASPDRKETIDWEGHPHNPPAPYLNPFIEDYRDKGIVDYLRACVDMWDKVVSGEITDEKVVKWLQQESNPHRLMPAEFLQELLSLDNDMTAAKRLLYKYSKQLRSNDEFLAVSEMVRQNGEDRFFLLKKEGNALWLKQWL